MRTRSEKAPHRRWRIIRVALGVFFALVTALVTALIVDAWTAFGHQPSADDWRRMGGSTQQTRGRFENPEPIKNHMLRFVQDLPDSSSVQSPDAPISVFEDGAAALARAPASDARITWMGHSSVLIELGGVRVLTDPVWGPVAGPWTWAGPRRFYAPPVSLEALGDLDAVLISHDHYDHLDHSTIAALAQKVPRFIVPLGVGAHLRYWGVPSEKITEVDWWDVVDVANIRITATPARHASGRQVFDQNRTLWCGYALSSASSNLYFSGDTGMFPGLREIGERLGPFDLAMIEVGAYNRAWPDWHIGPEQAAQAASWLQAKRLLPIHWGLFALAPHGWTEPIERVLSAAKERGLTTWTPQPGQPLELGVSESTDRWWPSLPWRDAQADPIVSSMVE